MITNGVVPSLHVDYKSTRIEQYHKEGCALRTETTINNTRDFGIGLKNPPALVARPPDLLRAGEDQEEPGGTLPSAKPLDECAEYSCFSHICVVRKTYGFRQFSVGTVPFRRTLPRLSFVSVAALTVASRAISDKLLNDLNHILVIYALFLRCDRLGVKFPGATRRRLGTGVPTAPALG